MAKVQPSRKDAPHPGSYEIQRDFEAKGVLSWRPEKHVEKEQDVAPGPGDYQTLIAKENKSLVTCFNSTTNRFGVAQKLRTDKKPGPGDYEPTIVKKASYNVNSEGYFNSKTVRFDNRKTDSSLGPGVYFN